MTTNKPPIAAWAPSTALRKLESRHNNAPCILTDTPAEFNDVALVRLADYEALQSAHEEELFQVRQDRDAHFGSLMRALEQVDALQDECEALKRALSESQANDRQAMAYLNEVRAIVGGDDFPDMVRRCERLQAKCARLQAATIEAKGHISHYMYGGSSYREPAVAAIALIDAALAAHRQGDEE